MSDDIHRLQNAFAELQIREKLGVIESNTWAVRQGKPAVAFNLRQDALAVLPLYEHASEGMRVRYSNALRAASIALREARKEPGEDELQTVVTQYAEDLKTRGFPEQADSLLQCIGVNNIGEPNAL